MKTRALFVFTLLFALFAFFACGGDTTKQEGAVVLIITTDLSLSDMNTFRVEVSQEQSPGVYGEPLFAKDYAMPAEATLPASLTITAGTAASQNVLVRVIGRKVEGGSNTAVVLREAELRVPTDRVAALTMLLAAACAGQVKTDAAGHYVSTCPNPHESCQPTTGACGSSFVDVNTLPTYDPSRDASVPTVAIGDGSVNNVGPSQKEILSFVLAGVTGTISGSDIFISLPPGANLKGLVPTVKWAGAKITPDPSLPQDWQNPLQYTVTAKDGSELIYTVHVTIAEPTTKKINSFTVPNGHTLYGTDDSIDLELPYGTDVTHLVPTIAFTGKSISPQSGVAQNFTNPVLYTVTAFDDSTRVYTVSAIVASASDAKITSFKINGIEGDISGTDIRLDFPNGIDWSALTADVLISGKSITPDPKQPRDYSSPVKFTVVSPDGAGSTEYTVTVKRPTVSNVMMSPMGGSFTHVVNVKLTCRSPDTEIHYTLDGAEPTKSSPLYTTPINMPVGSQNKKLKARCFSAKLNPALLAQFQQYSVQSPGAIDLQDELVFPATNCGQQAAPLTFNVTNNSGSSQSYSAFGALPAEFSFPTPGTIPTGTSTITVTPAAVPNTVSDLDDITAAVTITFGSPAVGAGTITLRQLVGVCPP